LRIDGFLLGVMRPLVSDTADVSTISIV